MSPSPFDPNHSAMLSMDLQSGIVSIYTSGNNELVSRAASLLEKFPTALKNTIE